MKYAVVNQRGGINRVSETEPKHVVEGATVVEITDEQAAQIAEGRQATPPIRYHLVDGALVTHADYVASQRTYTAEQWLAMKLAPNKGDIGVRLVGLQNLELGLAQAQKSSAKLTAMREWINGIMGLYAQDQSPRNDWPEPPHTFEETFSEAAAELQAE